MTTAPIAIAAALEPLNELLPDEAVELVPTAVGVWVLLVATGGLGNPSRGFVPLP